MCLNVKDVGPNPRLGPFFLSFDIWLCVGVAQWFDIMVECAPSSRLILEVKGCSTNTICLNIEDDWIWIWTLAQALMWRSFQVGSNFIHLKVVFMV